MSELIQNPWVGFAGSIFGVVGVLLSVYFFFRSSKYQQPAVLKRSMRWFDGRLIPHKDIQLVFRGTTVDRFTITHLIFWNAGNLPIRPSDFAPTSPLRITIPKGIALFDISLSGVTAPELDVKLGDLRAVPENDGVEVPINFAFFEQDSGFSVQVIHDGENDRGIDVVGKLPGVNEFKKLASSMRRSERFLYMRRNFPQIHTERWVDWAMSGYLMSIGLVGVSAIYRAVFVDFHWYHIPLGFFSFLVLMPFVILGEVRPPKELAAAITAQAPSDW